MNNDQVKGRTQQLAGTIKETARKVVGDRKLEIKGKLQRVYGEAQTSDYDESPL